MVDPFFWHFFISTNFIACLDFNSCGGTFIMGSVAIILAVLRSLWVLIHEIGIEEPISQSYSHVITIWLDPGVIVSPWYLTSLHPDAGYIRIGCSTNSYTYIPSTGRMPATCIHKIPFRSSFRTTARRPCVPGGRLVGIWNRGYPRREFVGWPDMCPGRC